MDVVELVKQDSAEHGAPACVLCDESQFFTPEQAEQLFLVTVDLGIPVICYGLRADFMMRGFLALPACWNSGCGLLGLDFSSGCACVAMNQG